MEQKYCSKCNTSKPFSEFGKSKKERYGLKHKCKECCKAYAREHYKNNVAMYRKNDKKYKYKLFYNLSEELATKLANDNTGNCEICGEFGKLAVDHCHSTLKFRGLLCRNCNIMLGLAKDKIETLMAGIKYLQEKV